MSGNRTSIFEAFSVPHTTLPVPSLLSRPQLMNVVRYQPEDTMNQVIHVEDNENDYEYSSVFNDVEEIENCGEDNATLWMSCSPGRDSGDEEPLMDNATSYEMEHLDEYQQVERCIPIEVPMESSMILDEQEFLPSKVKLKSKDVKGKDQSSKPLSSYALFFRDTQIAIKDQNPTISFGEISRVVATMWDNLDESHKQYYNKLADEAKQEKMLKKERAIQKHLKDKSAKKNAAKDKKQISEKHEKTTTTTTTSSKYSKHKSTATSRGGSDKAQTISQSKCLREGCSNKAIYDARWNREYCSTQCVVSHCKDVYKAWVALRKSTTSETETT